MNFCQQDRGRGRQGVWGWRPKEISLTATPFMLATDVVDALFSAPEVPVEIENVMIYVFHFHFILKFFKEGNPSAKMLVFKGPSN